MSEIFRISKIRVDGYGPIVSNDFYFPNGKNPDQAEIHLFTGQNGSGKSTMLSIISGIINGLDPRKVRKDCSLNVEISYESESPLDNGSNITKFSFVNNGVHRNTQFQPLLKYKTKIGNPANHIHDFAMFAYSGHRQLNTVRIQGINELTTNPFSNALNFEASTNPQQLIQWVANMKTKEALAMAKNDTVKTKKYRESLLRIELVISKIIKKDIKFVLEDDPLNVVIRYENTDLDFSLLPDGLKSIVSWVSDLLMRMDRLKWKDGIEPFKRRFILLLDEIDVHLHPEWQRQILPIIQSLFVNAQIFSSTHSPFVVGSCDNVYIHNLSGDSQIVKPILSEDSKSYETILKEIFGIGALFGVVVESKLDEFRLLRKNVLAKKSMSPDNQLKMTDLLDYFSSQNSIEIQSIIGSEIRQLERLLGINVRK